MRLITFFVSNVIKIKFLKFPVYFYSNITAVVQLVQGWLRISKMLGSYLAVAYVKSFPTFLQLHQDYTFNQSRLIHSQILPFVVVVIIIYPMKKKISEDF